MSMNEFQYHKVEESNLYSFYQIPKELTINTRYKHISNDAKFLYGLLRDRHQLSVKNNWIDNEGHIYIIFTRDEAMEILNVAKEKISKIFKELVDVGLIREKRQGLTKPNITYVGKIIHERIDNTLKSENRTSGSSKIESQEVRKSNTNNTDINNTDINTHTGDLHNVKIENKTDVKTLCVDIKNILGDEIRIKTIQSLINSFGIDKVLHYLKIWDKYRQFAKTTQSAYFIHCIQNNIPIPISIAKTAKANNDYPDFDQREYSAEDFEKFYYKIPED